MQKLGGGHRPASGRLYDLQLQARARGAEHQGVVALCDLALRWGAVDGPRAANPEALAGLQLEVGADEGIQRSHRPGELGRLPGRIQAALGGGDLLGVGGACLILLAEGELARGQQVERTDQQLRPLSGQTRGQVV